MIKIAYFLAFASGSSFTIYGQRGKMLGRTQLNKHLKRQVLRMPDEPVKREDWTKQVFLTFDNGNPPMPHILAEDTEQELGSEKRFSPVDLSLFGLVTADEVKTNIQGPNPDPQTGGTAAGLIVELLKSNGKLTINQLSDLLELGQDHIIATIRSPLFVLDDSGWVDLAPVSHPPTAPAAKKKVTAKKKGKTKK